MSMQDLSNGFPLAVTGGGGCNSVPFLLKFSSAVCQEETALCKEMSRSNQHGSISDGSRLASSYFCYPDAGHVFSGVSGSIVRRYANS